MTLQQTHALPCQQSNSPCAHEAGCFFERCMRLLSCAPRLATTGSIPGSLVLSTVRCKLCDSGRRGQGRRCRHDHSGPAKRCNRASLLAQGLARLRVPQRDYHANSSVNELNNVQDRLAMSTLRHTAICDALCGGERRAHLGYAIHYHHIQAKHFRCFRAPFELAHICKTTAHGGPGTALFLIAIKTLPSPQTVLFMIS